jgi:hypothetical protein
MLWHLLHYAFLGSLIGDIGGWLAGKFKNAKDLAGAVWKALKHLWSTISAVFHHVGAAWLSMWRAVQALDRALSFLADSTRNALQWVVHNLNPKSVGHAIGKAVSWAAKEISKAAHSLSSRVAGVYRWAKGAINSVSHRLAGAARYLLRKANTALAWIGHQGAQMWRLLQSAPRLAAWLVGALITPLFRYIVGHIEALAIMIGRWMLANSGKLALDLERAIARIF